MNGSMAFGYIFTAVLYGAYWLRQRRRLSQLSSRSEGTN